MTRRFDSTPTGDKPRDHVAPRTAGGSHPQDAEERRGVRGGVNPQASTPGWNDQRRRRWDWLRGSIADVAGAGGAPDRADIERVPEKHRPRVREIDAEARRLHEQGDQAAARQHAREELLAVEGDIAPTWKVPGVERPDEALLDEIQAGAYTSGG